MKTMRNRKAEMIREYSDVVAIYGPGSPQALRVRAEYPEFLEKANEIDALRDYVLNGLFDDVLPESGRESLPAMTKAPG